MREGRGRGGRFPALLRRAGIGVGEVPVMLSPVTVWDPSGVGELGLGVAVVVVVVVVAGMRRRED